MSGSMIGMDEIMNTNDHKPMSIIISEQEKVSYHPNQLPVLLTTNLVVRGYKNYYFIIYHYMHYPEIICPWGSYNKAMVAGHYGADAIYIGVPYTSLRMRQNKLKDFVILEKTINDIHALGKKAYLTMNIFPRNMDISIFESVMEKIAALSIDAIIFSDPWTFNIIKKYLPNTKLHLSTQANTLNYEAIKFWYDLWVQRVVLARELTLKEIKTIKEKVPQMELEVFVHWSMCIAYSGRCLLGEYFSGRDGNKWECSHVCRYKFNNQSDPTDELLYLWSVSEERRKDKKFVVAKDDEWSYMFSSKDLCTIDRLAEIMPYVDWLKIEWRSKGEWYLWAVTKSYVHARDCVIAGKQIDLEITNLIQQMPHRPYWNWFFFNDVRCAPDGEGSWITEQSAWPIVSKEYYGLILPETKDIIVDGQTISCHHFIVKQQMQTWIQLEYISPNNQWTITIIWFFDKNGKSMTEVKTTGDDIYIITNKVCVWREILYGPVCNY